MRLYIYLNKELIKCLAAKISNIKFDIDFFEYSEKRGYTVNNNTSIRPEIENKDKEGSHSRTRIGLSGEQGTLCNIEVFKRYINIEDISNIKNNNFYYSILENIPEDSRIKRKIGRIKELQEGYFKIGKDKFLIDSQSQDILKEEFDNECDITCIGYKINCLNSEFDIYKTIAVYIE